jgi:hypothetical protein
MKEVPNLLEEYLHSIIEQKAKETSRMASNAPNDDAPVVDEAIFYDILANEPRPWLGADNDPEDDNGGI